MIPKFDIQSDNFELFFEAQMNGMADYQRERIPTEIRAKVFKPSGKINSRSIRKLNFLGKLWILFKALKKRVWILIENEETGLTIEEFVELGKAVRIRDMGQKRAESLKASGTFCTASKELGDTLDYLNGLSVGPMYNYLMKYRNFEGTGTARNFEEKVAIIRMIRYYEANKRVWSWGGRLNLQEWYALTYLYDKEWVNGSQIHSGFYKNAYYGSYTLMRRVYSSLLSKSFIQKQGYRSGAVYRITPLGRDAVDSILKQYAINY